MIAYGGRSLRFPETALTPRFRDPFAPARPSRIRKGNYDNVFMCTFRNRAVFRPFAKHFAALSWPFATEVKTHVQGMHSRFWVWGRQSACMHLVHHPSPTNHTWSLWHLRHLLRLTIPEDLPTSCILWKAHPFVGSRSCNLLCPQSVFSGSQIVQTIRQWVEGGFHFYQWSSHP